LDPPPPVRSDLGDTVKELAETKPVLQYEFGPFRLDEADRVLLRGEDVVPLAVKAFEILAHLVKNRGHVIPKDVLIRHVWADCFVEENNLTQNISALRRALADDVDHPTYIETIPRRGYRFIAPVRERSATTDAQAAEAQARKNQVKSLAVLPFQSIGSPSDFLDVGLADALITKLSNLEQIEVRPTASTIGYKGAVPNWVQAGQDLKVDALLSGCIQRAGDRVRVTTQLVAAADGKTLWAGQFDELFTDIFTVEDSISQQVAQTLFLKLSSEDNRRLSNRSTTSPEAHRAYLRGRHHWNRRTEPDLKKSIRCFQEAVDLDPGYALAYAGMADSYSVLGGYGALSPRDSYLRARAAAKGALEIDESLAEAHTCLADVFMYYDWDSESAGREYRRAIELRPDYATAHHFHAWYLIACKQFEEAAAEMRRAHDLDPLSPVINMSLGLPHYYAHDFQRAIEQFEHALDLDPYFDIGHLYLGRAYLYSGQHERAMALLRKAVSLSEERPMMLAGLGHALGLTGAAKEARGIINRLISLGQTRYISPYSVAMVFGGLGQADDAFGWLERGFEERVNQMVILAIDPAWQRIRRDRRFDAIVKRVGFAA
jgi:DNA-binding winged helix-turn-helix (wHTH) protein/Tfp pilus assembly protein PilF